MRNRTTVLMLATCSTLSACQFSPLMNRIAVGEEPIVVMVGESADGSTDLFAASPGGGPVYQITFNRPVESHPALAPSGTVVAFFRQPVSGDSTTRVVMVMNLLNASERELELPTSAGAPLEVAWRPTGTTLLVRTTTGVWEMQAPPAQPVPRRLVGESMGRAALDLMVAVGDPVFAIVDNCVDGGVCTYALDGRTPQQISPRGTGPLRWGSDSVAWFDQDRLEVRPLGPGRSRHVMWTQTPANPRQATYAPGPAGPRQGETGLVVPR